VRFDFDNGVYSEPGYGKAGDEKLVMKSCDGDRAVVVLGRSEQLVEFEQRDVARVWYGDTPQSTVGLIRLRDDDGHLALAAPYVYSPYESGVGVDGGTRDSSQGRVNATLAVGDRLGLKLVSDELAAAEQACGSGDATACGSLGKILRRRGESAGYTDGFAEHVKARDCLELACNGGVAESCRDALWITRHGDGSASRAFAQRGCTLGDNIACDMLALYLREGYGGPQDLSRANVIEGDLRQVYEKRCSAGDSSACASASELWEHGKGGPRDPRRAEELAGLACLDPDSAGCIVVRQASTTPSGSARPADGY